MSSSAVYCHHVDREQVLLRTSVFGGLTAADLEELTPHLRERRFARGESVWLEGDESDAVYVVAEGQLKAYRVSRDGAEVILRVYPTGDMTGEVGLFHPSGIRQVNVSAMVATRCLTLGRDPLLAFLTRHPDAMRRMLEKLSVVAAQAAYSFTGMAFDDIRRRVAAALVTLVDEFGESTETGVRIRLRLSQGTLAALVAASRENVNRALSALVAGGAISQDAGYFHVHDLTALARVAAGEV